MRRLAIKRHGAPTPAPLPLQHHGYNGAYAPQYIDFPDSVAKAQSLKAHNANFVVRLMGGTIGNFYHVTGNGYGMIYSELPDTPAVIKNTYPTDATYSENHLTRMIAWCLEVGCDVLWMGNMYTGTSAETITAIAALLAAGINVIGVELSNEAYLLNYADKYATYTPYFADAKTFRDDIKAAYPTMPCGLVIAPSAAMKDAESAGNPAKLDDWNAAARLLTWPDALILHAYVFIDPAVTPYNTTAATNACISHRAALAAHIATFPGFAIWITEWNIAGNSAGGTDTQAEHWTAMKAYFASEPRITIETQHLLLSGSTTGNNAIDGEVGGCTLTRIGNLAAS